jgi:hypothetical protein
MEKLYVKPTKKADIKDLKQYYGIANICFTS